MIEMKVTGARRESLARVRVRVKVRVKVGSLPGGLVESTLLLAQG